jgi:hypothetical protein
MLAKILYYIRVWCFGTWELYFEMHLTHILNFKAIETKNSHVHLHVLSAHKIVS